MRHFYMPLADRVFIYDNSDANGILIASRQLNAEFRVQDENRWRKIEGLTQ